MMKSRKERKLEAKQHGVAFVPQYNGTGVLSFEDYYGVGNERFNNKFVQFLKPSETPHELSEGTPIEEVVEEALDVPKVEVEEAELVEEPKSKKGKLKKKLKKLFNK